MTRMQIRSELVYLWELCQKGTTDTGTFTISDTWYGKLLPCDFRLLEEKGLHLQTIAMQKAKFST
jgi:hypothetical protein